MLKVLLVAEGSGGHLIPALQVAQALAKQGAQTKVWYAQRQPLVGLSTALAQEPMQSGVEVDSIPLESRSSLIRRLWQCGQLWHRAQRCFDTFTPDVVVGFGGWLSAPVMLAAKNRRIGCVLHEQNVVMGKANRVLAHWADRVAVSFRETQRCLGQRPSVVTGLPIRANIGQLSRADAAKQFDFDPTRPTLLILGGSQGARAINRLMMQAAELLSSRERQTWQLLHVTGSADEGVLCDAYTANHVTAWVAPYLVQMEAAYALADLVIARAGASTIAELARCGLPAILIPYPGAGAHQVANARMVESRGGAVVLDESKATPAQLLETATRILTDERLRTMMGTQMRTLGCANADEQLREVIVAMAHTRISRKPSRHSPCQ